MLKQFKDANGTVELTPIVVIQTENRLKKTITLTGFIHNVGNDSEDPYGYTAEDVDFSDAKKVEEAERSLYDTVSKDLTTFAKDARALVIKSNQWDTIKQAQPVPGPKIRSLAPAASVA
jgi:hypothetical protein